MHKLDELQDKNLLQALIEVVVLNLAKIKGLQDSSGLCIHAFDIWLLLNPKKGL